MGEGAPGTVGGAEIVGVQPDRVTSTDTDPSNKVATQLGSLKPLAEMEKLPWVSAWPKGGPLSTVTVEFGTAPDPTMVSCPLTRLACEVTIAALAGIAAPTAAASTIPATNRTLIVPRMPASGTCQPSCRTA